MESAAHLQLKRLALGFLLAQGCRAAAVEVRCPQSRSVADAAGYLDALPKSAAPRTWRLKGVDEAPAPEPLIPRGGAAKTIVIECKAERSDFLRETADREAVLARRAELELERARLENEHLPRVEPHLRRSGTSLFSELETWDYGASRSGAYRAVLRELGRLDVALHGGTKFSRFACYRVATHCFLLTPRGLVKRREMPAGWGLLECSRRWLEGAAPGSATDGSAGAPTVSVTVASPEHLARTAVTQRMLRNIAVAATRASLGLGAASPGTPSRVP
jgi:hypothetical protein